jgi:serine/threonine protein kinase
MPPEQTRDAATVDYRADIYSLGATLYKMLTGQPPYRKKTVESMVKAIRRDPLPDPRIHSPDIPERVVEIVQVAMAKKPENRFQAVREMQEELVKVWKSLS